LNQSPEHLLARAIESQLARMRGYEIPSEALTLETVRAIDYLFCRELFTALRSPDENEKRHQLILRCGVNEALARVLPTELAPGQPRIFQSSRRTQELADELLFDSGLLWLAQLQLTQLHSGFLTARLDPHRKVRGMNILVLTSADSTLYHERVGYAGVNWLSDRALLRGRPREEELRRVREAMLPQMTARLLAANSDREVELFPEADEHFHECAKVYLQRMPYRDLLSDTDRIGGRPYSDYVEVLTALSTLSETRLCTTSILNAARPRIGIRNLLTGGASTAAVVEAVASFLDADTAEIERLLSHLAVKCQQVLS
jgi:hypothetical protein